MSKKINDMKPEATEKTYEIHQSSRRLRTRTRGYCRVQLRLLPCLLTPLLSFAWYLIFILEPSSHRFYLHAPPLFSISIYFFL